MLLAMYGASLSGSVGRTWKACTMPGQIIPSRIADSTSSARPTDGRVQVRRQMFRKKSTAQMTAMPSRMFLAGSTAWSSV